MTFIHEATFAKDKLEQALPIMLKAGYTEDMPAIQNMRKVIKQIELDVHIAMKRSA